MRPLMRLSLFAAARLTLLLVVVVWIAAWCGVSVEIYTGPVLGSELLVDSSSYGYEIDWYEESKDNRRPAPFFRAVKYDPAVNAFGCGRLRLVTDTFASYCYGDGTLFMIRHWLILTPIVALNVLLHLVFRRRTDELS